MATRAVTPSEALQMALTALLAGDLMRAYAICDGLLGSMHQSPDALMLMGIIAYQSGDPQKAASLIDTASVQDQRLSLFYHLAARVLHRQGQFEDAAICYLEAIMRYQARYLAATEPNNLDDFQKLLLVVEETAKACPGLLSQRISITRQLNSDRLTLLPGLLYALRRHSHLLAPRPDAWQRLLLPRFTVSDSPVFDKLLSIIICSVDDDKFNRAERVYREFLKGEPFEIIRIPNAKSLAEGYNRGLRQAQGEYVLLVHDDLEILSPQFKFDLHQALQKVDIVGLAGTRTLYGGDWKQAGWPHLVGHAGHRDPDKDVYYSLVFGGRLPLETGIKALDGVFLATRREILKDIPFDETVFDGFHLYDMDLTFSAYQKGYQLGILTTLSVIHHSSGSFNTVYEMYNDRFIQKHQGHFDPPTENALKRWFTFVFDSQEQLNTFSSIMAGLFATTPA